MIHIGAGRISITVPDWMSEEYIEMAIGGVVGGFGAGLINGLVTGAIGEKVGASVKQAVSGALDLLFSYISHRIAGWKPEIKAPAFGSAVVLFSSGILKLISAVLSALTGKTYIMSVGEAYAIGESYGKTVVAGNFYKGKQASAQAIVVVPETTTASEPVIVSTTKKEEIIPEVK